MRFIVVADSHIRFPDDDIATYRSNALIVDRNRRAVELCNRIYGEFVVHLGDIVHPLPVEAGHEPAAQLAADVYEQLMIPIHFVPGNHDIGDKPNSLVAVPSVAEASYEVYERYWGAPFRSFARDGCHFVIVDTPVLNSGLDREAQQMEWLEAELDAAVRAGQRIFLFTHYPPFVRSPGESEHYDNLGEPARSWLLDLLAKYRVEAVFSGHVHNFLYNHYRGTELYVLPSTGFVRPDYSELAPIAPASEGGRDDPPKLGFFIVELEKGGHVVRPVRTNGATDLGEGLPATIAAALIPGWVSPVGVTLRHGWMGIADFPISGLDEFRRKRVRSDATLPALWEARINNVRIPLEDIAGDEGRERVAALSGRGMRFTVRSAGVPDAATRAAVAALEAGLGRWEIVAPPDDFPAVIAAIGSRDVRVALAPLMPVGDPGAGVHHFVTAGFDLGDDAAVEAAAELDPNRRVGEFVFRVGDGVAISAALDQAAEMAAAFGRAAVVDIRLPRGAESTVFDDDEAVAARVAEAATAASRRQSVAVFLDGFMDHDRGYYPHHGLIDRRYNPRRALHKLIEEASQLVHR